MTRTGFANGTPRALLAARRPSIAAAAVAASSLVVMATTAAPAAACSVCYGSAENGSPLITAARLGVFLLLGVTVVVLGGFAKFFFYLRNRARLAEIEGVDSEWAQLQRSSSS